MIFLIHCTHFFQATTKLEQQFYSFDIPGTSYPFLLDHINMVARGTKTLRCKSKRVRKSLHHIKHQVQSAGGSSGTEHGTVCWKRIKVDFWPRPMPPPFFKIPNIRNNLNVLAVCPDQNAYIGG